MELGHEQAQSFASLKYALSNKPMALDSMFQVGQSYVLVSDASPVGLGGVLLQEQMTGEFKPIAYISRSLSPAETRYSQIEREACVWATERFHNYLCGREFSLFTDNKPLVSLLDVSCKSVSSANSTFSMEIASI